MEPIPHTYSNPARFAWLWPSAAWHLAKENYLQAMAIVGVMTLWGAASAALSWKGGNHWIITAGEAFVGAYAVPGFLHVGKSWTEGRRTRLSDFFIGYLERGLFVRYLPVAVLSLVLGGLVNLVDENGNFLGLVIILLFFWSLIFVGPIVMYKKVPLPRAVGWSIEVFCKNIVPIILTGALFLVIVVAAAVALVVPFFLVAMPLAVPYFYLVSASCIDGLDPEKIILSYTPASPATLANPH